MVPLSCIVTSTILYPVAGAPTSVARVKCHCPDAISGLSGGCAKGANTAFIRSQDQLFQSKKSLFEVPLHRRSKQDASQIPDSLGDLGVDLTPSNLVDSQAEQVNHFFSCLCRDIRRLRRQGVWSSHLSAPTLCLCPFGQSARVMKEAELRPPNPLGSAPGTVLLDELTRPRELLHSHYSTYPHAKWLHLQVEVLHK